MSKQAEHHSDVAHHTVTTDTITSVLAELKTLIRNEIDNVDERIGEEKSTAPQSCIQDSEGFLLGMTIMGHKIIHYLQRKLLY